MPSPDGRYPGSLRLHAAQSYGPLIIIVSLFVVGTRLLFHSYVTAREVNDLRKLADPQYSTPHRYGMDICVILPAASRWVAWRGPRIETW
jgi:hypothetical protein